MLAQWHQEALRSGADVAPYKSGLVCAGCEDPGRRVRFWWTKDTRCPHRRVTPGAQALLRAYLRWHNLGLLPGGEALGDRPQWFVDAMVLAGDAVAMMTRRKKDRSKLAKAADDALAALEADG